jgi:hypothetical protein
LCRSGSKKAVKEGLWGYYDKKTFADVIQNAGIGTAKVVMREKIQERGYYERKQPRDCRSSSHVEGSS